MQILAFCSYMIIIFDGCTNAMHIWMHTHTHTHIMYPCTIQTKRVVMRKNASRYGGVWLKGLTCMHTKSIVCRACSRSLLDVRGSSGGHRTLKSERRGPWEASARKPRVLRHHIYETRIDTDSDVRFFPFAVLVEHRTPKKRT